MRHFHSREHYKGYAYIWFANLQPRKWYMITEDEDGEARSVFPIPLDLDDEPSRQEENET